MYDYEQKYRSVVSGVIHARKSPGDESDSPLLQQAKRDGWRMWTLRDGLESLVIKLHQILLREGVEIKLNSPCTYLTTTESKEVVVMLMFQSVAFITTMLSLNSINACNTYLHIDAMEFRFMLDKKS